MHWIDRFPALERLEPGMRRLAEDQSQVIHVPKDTVIFGPGKTPENLLLVLDGTVRVEQVSEAGREIVLYRVHPGESCVLTTACLLAHEDYSAEGVAETAVEAVAIPRAVFDQLLAESKVFREFVFSAYSRRITEMFLVIEEIAFQRMDIRLAQKLLELGRRTGAVLGTHQQLAAELGTAREVISRQLAEFQRRGWVELTRGKVALADVEAIGRLAGSG
jgi:CRP/FNR family transcriptional regulator